jgi:hypothetical protein
MPTPRRIQVDLEATPFYHCISRCVRRAFLCGPDRLSGRNFDHRKVWLVDRLKELAALFAIDVNAYGVMSNHFHLVLHIDRARALAWSEAEVIERWGVLFPQRGNSVDTHPSPAVFPAQAGALSAGKHSVNALRRSVVGSVMGQAGAQSTARNCLASG